MLLQITKDELYYHRKQYYETMFVHGIPCKIYSIEDKHEVAYDIYNDIQDIESSYDDGIDTYMTFEELPTTRTLKSLGWYIDGEQPPAVGYLPLLYRDNEGHLADFRPNIDDKVVLVVDPQDTNPESRERTFLIKDIRGNGFPGSIYLTAKLVPYYQDEKR